MEGAPHYHCRRRGIYLHHVYTLSSSEVLGAYLSLVLAGIGVTEGSLPRSISAPTYLPINILSCGSMGYTLRPCKTCTREFLMLLIRAVMAKARYQAGQQPWGAATTLPRAALLKPTVSLLLPVL